MASTTTKVIGVRVPLALAEKWEAEAVSLGLSVSGLIVADKESVDDLKARIAELETELSASKDAIQPFRDEIAELKKFLAVKPLDVFRSHPSMKIVDPKVHHVSGPVLADPVPRDVSGEVPWCGLKGQTKGKKP